jgi:hypothetical protein
VPFKRTEEVAVLKRSETQLIHFLGKPLAPAYQEPVGAQSDQKTFQNQA